MTTRKCSRNLLLTAFLLLTTYNAEAAPDIGTDFYVTWADRLVESPDGGKTITLSLDYNSGSAIGTTNKYMFGYFSADIKLVGGNSAGTLATFYLKSIGEYAVHDELDFEFLGNSSGQPYALQTNVFANDLGGREQRMNLWFDPTAGFHNYAILWNRHMIIFYVDSTPIRVFPNNNRLGVNYVQSNPMKLYSTIYNADDWVTQGGKVKIDWRWAPFRVTFKNYNLQGCASQMSGATQCSTSWWDEPRYWSLTTGQYDGIKYIQQRYVTYNYCTDLRRNPTPPPECANT
ncbi:xyloglucan:xyloglucosyl transferase [Marchantia polymorpha subsp. ruderalis]|uniref:Xyloglucan endotransglucosylase/hydrolase n=1 Tax=Marchantia polymorpha TaxID=3197 RepID=A0A2R6XMT8_MARPO|nr:hypothetical protein MARPO_0008s0185 [Marchantia polymorpha]BBN19398.1 hypothetical protein Mp_8g10370 [Marchantia polymorpha subsp. ruderalis]|eukprot:PTQ47434.1 hypothetical protein MARPO_0008s0185 [Marchantia polymorpha]